MEKQTEAEMLIKDGLREVDEFGNLKPIVLMPQKEIDPDIYWQDYYDKDYIEKIKKDLARYEGRL